MSEMVARTGHGTRIQSTAKSVAARVAAALLPVLLLVTVLAGVARAQRTQGVSQGDTLVLDLERAVKIALGSSPEAFYADVSERQSYYSFRGAALDLYSPQIDLNVNTPTFQQSLTEQLIYDPAQGKVVREWIEAENRRWESDFSLRQPLPTGGQLRLESNLYRRFYASDITADEEELEFSSSYRLIFSQELLRGNLRRIAKQRAELSYEQATLNGAQRRSDLVFNVIESFYGLLASARELEINRDDLAANRETAELARRKYEAGLLPEVEAMQLEVEAARVETDLLSAEAAYESRLDQFRNTLGLEMDVPVRIAGEPEFDTISVSLDSAISRALDRSEEVRLAQIEKQQAELSLDDARRPWRLGAQVSGFYNLELRDPSFNDAFSSDYDDYSVNRGFTFSLTVPLFSGGRRNAEVQRARLAKRRAEFDAEQSEKQVVLAVRSAVRNLREARMRYEITLRSLRIAERSWEISRERFSNGQITARDWIDAQLALNRSRVSATRALMDHNIAQARYRLVIGDDVLPGLEIGMRSGSDRPDR